MNTFTLIITVLCFAALAVLAIGATWFFVKPHDPADGPEEGERPEASEATGPIASDAHRPAPDLLVVCMDCACVKTSLGWTRDIIGSNARVSHGLCPSCFAVRDAALHALPPAQPYL